MSLREILQSDEGNKWAVVTAKNFNPASNITIISTPGTHTIPANKIINGLIYAPFSNALGNATLNFPSISQLDSLFKNPPIGEMFYIDFASGKSQNFSFTILLGVGCVTPVGGFSFSTSGAADAANYYHIIFERQVDAYVFYTYPGI